MLIEPPDDPLRPIAVVPVGEDQVQAALEVAQRLRRAGLTVELAFTGTLRKRLSHADRINARAAVLLGEDELKRSMATVRDLESGAQVEVALDALQEHLDRFR